jgi:low affinity Fe/Cu permease
MKLDELIIYTKGADNELVELENLSDEQMDRMERHYHRLAKVLGKTDVAPPNGNSSSPRRNAKPSAPARNRKSRA